MLTNMSAISSAGKLILALNHSVPKAPDDPFRQLPGHYHQARQLVAIDENDLLGESLGIADGGIGDVAGCDEDPLVSGMLAIQRPYKSLDFFFSGSLAACVRSVPL
jgi:hypothetical protein